MASMTTSPVEQPGARPSFARVAASSYTPHRTPDATSNTKTSSPRTQAINNPQIATPLSFGSIAPRSQEGERRKTILARPEDSDAINTHVMPTPLPKNVKSAAVDDQSTQLSSSDGSGKPPSIDGKSVASGTTFALDEKESLRPDDSASLRATDDGTSPPGSTVADSQAGSEVSAARAFSEQLREIATMGPVAHRGAPAGRIPPAQFAFANAPYTDSQPASGTVPIAAQVGIPLKANVLHQDPPPDEKLLEALNSQRDRVWVLKLEQDLIDFVNNRDEDQMPIPNCNAFYRMLAHKLADYYLLAHTFDDSLAAVVMTKTQYTRKPLPIASYSNNGQINTPPVEVPARKIMRRGEDGKASGNTTTPNSDGPSNAASDVGCNGSNGSDGGNDPKSKAAKSMEDRMAKYQEVRQRIFGADSGETGDGTEKQNADGAENSRSSSTIGKKTKKKQRNYDDEDFESRAHFNAYPPSTFSPTGYAPENSNMMYGQFPAAINQQPYQMMSPPLSQQMQYANGYPMQQEMPQQYVWQGQMYQNAPQMSYGVPATVGYDLPDAFQRSMQFQPSANGAPQMQKGNSNMMGAYQPSPQGMPQNWSPMLNQSGFPQNPTHFQQNGAPSTNQGPYPVSYPYGQLPPPAYSNGKQSKIQHPVPGSYNRNTFNPQSQAFVPGGRATPFQMPSQHAQMTPPPMHSFPNQGYPIQAQAQGQRPSPPNNQPNSFGSPHISHNTVAHSSPIIAKGNGNRPYNQQQLNMSFTQMPNASPVPSFSQTPSPSVPAQSSIAKWGTPSSLPPKPPPPASMQAPKFSLPGQNMSAAARLPPAPVVANGRPH